MSSLGQKVKELFHSSDSPSAARGEVDPNTPGSFPVDDMRPKEPQDDTTATTTGQEHNKLHKPDDPRGWTEGDETSGGHAYKDSGVGLTDSSVPHQEVTSAKPDPSESVEVSQNLETKEPLERTSEPTTADRQLDDSTTLGTSEPTGALGESSTKGQTATPYWGDLPQGQGVYNTVAGHGSAEDNERAALHSGGQDTQTSEGVYDTVTGHESAEGKERTSSIPQGQGVYNTVAGHGSAEDDQRTSGLRSGAQDTIPITGSSQLDSGSQGQSQTTDPFSSQRATRNPDEKASGSHLAEALGGAAVLGAGAAAYGHKNRQADESAAPYQGSNDIATAAARAAFITKGTEPYSSQRDSTLTSGAATSLPRQGQDQTVDPYDSQRAVHNPEEKDNGSHFLKGAAGAAAGTAAAGAYEHHKHRKDDEASKTVEEPKESKGRSFSLLHRDHKDDEASKTVEEPKESKGRSFPLLHRDHKDKEVKEHKHEKEPKESKLSGLFHRSRKDEAEPETRTDEDKHRSSKAAAAALGAAGAGGAAYAATRDRREDDKAQDATTAGRYQDSTVPQTSGQQAETSFVNQPSGAGYGTSQGYNTQTSQFQDPFARDSTSQQQGQHGHRGAELGTAAAAGLGAGALASHHGSSKHQGATAYGTQSNQPADPFARDPAQQQPSSAFGTQSNQPTDPLARDSSQQHEGSHRGAGLAAGAAATGLGAGALASHREGSRHPDSAAYGSQSSQPTESLTRDSTLPAYGTQPSGAGYSSSQGYNTQTSQPQDPLARDSSTQQEGSHRGSGLATGAAAGLGAAALASHGHHGHQDSSRQEPYGTQSTQSSSTGIDPNYRGSGTQYDQPTNPLARDSQHEDSHRGSGLATGAAVGLGAGALASRSQHGDTQDLTQDTSRRYQPESSTASAGLGTTQDEPFTEKRTSSDSNPPLLTQHANEGQYNTLASGTPSGVRLDDNVEDTRSTPLETIPSDSAETKDKHYGAGAAGLGAAAAGAGTAAYLSRDEDEKTDEPVEEEKKYEPIVDDKKYAPVEEEKPKAERELEREGPVTQDLASTTGTSKPVIHKCQKCGEDNDISHYFTGKN